MAVAIPSFLNHGALKSLRRLVIINNILKGDYFASYTGQLSPNDRQIARTLLENQQSQLRQQLLRYIENAYGISRSDPDALDAEFELETVEHFQSLMPGLKVKPPTGANLNQALHHLMGQALTAHFPGYPLFNDEIRLTAAIVRAPSRNAV